MEDKSHKGLLEALVAKHGAPAPELRVFDMARQFHAVGVRSLTFDEPEPGVRLLYPAPGATCLGFAAELYLKSLYTMESGKRGQGHRLNVLYARLSVDIQTLIGARYFVRSGRDQGRLIQDLATWANIFVDWRYVFEREDHVQLDVGAVAALVSSLYDVARKLRPGWTSHPQAEKLLTSGLIRPGS